MFSPSSADAHFEHARGERFPSSEAKRTLVETLLHEVAREVEQGSLSQALRVADRARRLAPGEPTCRILCSQLLIQLQRPSEALDLLCGIDEPEAIVARGEALCLLGRWSDAAECCELVLRRFAVDAVESVCRLATRLCRVGSGMRFPGWIGCDSRLRLTGCVRTPDLFRIRLADRPLLFPEFGLQDGAIFRSFTCEPPADAMGMMTAYWADRAVLGSGLFWPPDFSLRGWVAVQGTTLVGEAQYGWSPRLPVTLSIESPQAELRKLTFDPDRGSEQCSFEVPLEKVELESGRLEVSAELPDGKRQALIGSPIEPRRCPAVPIGPRPFRSRREAGSDEPITRRKVDVVIPVFAGFEETLTCIHSVLATTNGQDAEVVVIDDSIPDPELRKALLAFAEEGRITLLTNRQNLGFAGSANRGIRLHLDRDVVLLNSDTEVFGGWFERMRDAAYRSTDIGTVTPLGEGDTITEYSRMTALGAGAAEIDRIASAANPGRHVELPVGVGFCLYIRRDCLDETGELDQLTFSKGYGEESDFCLRARRLGWAHVASADVYVSHIGGRSFGKQGKDLLLKRSRIVLNSLHPGYDKLVEEFHRQDPLLAVRRAIDQRFLEKKAVDPVILVTLDLPGGVKRHIDEREAYLTRSGHTVLILHSMEEEGRKGRVKLHAASLGLKNLVFDLPGDFSLLEESLRALQIRHIEIHHFLGLPPEALELVTALGAPFDVYVHDYLWICPRVTLIGGDGKYCGEPAVSECEKCVQRHGGALEESFTVEDLRARSGRILTRARAVIAPSEDARARFGRYFPQVSISVVPWEVQVEPIRSAATPAGPSLRVAVIGAIGIQKGHQVVVDCARDAAKRRLHLEFVIFGYTLDDELLRSTGKAFVIGPYKDSEIDGLLEREQCGAALFPSLWPETWCYALTHALRNGLPVVAFNCGAQSERLRGRADAELLPFSAAPQEINDSLIRLNNKMSSLRLPKEDLMDPSPSTQSPIAFEQISSSVKILTLPEGVYSFTVKRDSGPAASPGEATLPAVQVSLPPVRSAGTVEILTAASSLDRWLALESDMIVVRVDGGDASLMLTSLRLPDCPTLDVRISRLSAEPSSPSGEIQTAMAEQDTGAAGPRILLQTHIRNVGDLEFEDCWAGWPGQQLWIEGFSVSVAETEALGEEFSNSEIEYCAVTAEGFETPWLSNQELCGSRGAGMPILGFGVRLKAQAAEKYDCAYRGRFFSGATVGPLTGGALCCSEIPGDPLEGLEVQLTKRRAGGAPSQNAAEQYSLES